MLFGREVDIIGQDEPYNYRNRMDFVITKNKLGLKANFHTVVDIDCCEILINPLNVLLKKIRSWVQKHDLEGCSPGTFDGYLRFVMLRGDNNQQQVTLTTTSDENRELIKELYESLQVTSLVWTIEQEQSEESVGSVHEVFGQEHILLSLAGKSFRISSHTFFQTSPHMASQAINTIKKFVDTTEVFDLYCGVGVMGQCVSEQVIGVDNNSDNILQARKNAQLNGVQAEYVCADASQALRDSSPELVIVDPPRTGLQSAVHTLMAAAPRRIIYLSCNPKTQARDLLALQSVYEVTYLQAFDFFAHTDHIECLAVLDKKR